MFDTVFAYSQNGTPVYLNAECHPHFTNKVAIEAIQRMTIPTVPADPTDRNQTRVCETHDLGRVIGVNHRVTRDDDCFTFYVDRGIDNPRGYQSFMILKPCEPESKVTTVVIWYEGKWVLLTNHEGAEDPYPEPGTTRYEALEAAEQYKASKYFYRNPLSPTRPELEKAIKELEEYIDKEEPWLESWECGMPSLEWNARMRDLETLKRLLNAMKEFRKYAK